VLKYLRQERGVLLAQASPKNLARLQVLRDQDINATAAVTAAKTLETLASEQFGPVSRGFGGGQRAGYLIDLSDEPSPGVVIQIINAPARPQTPGDAAIDVTPIPLKR
jgi:hypothetical protein